MSLNDGVKSLLTRNSPNLRSHALAVDFAGTRPVSVSTVHLLLLVVVLVVLVVVLLVLLVLLLLHRHHHHHHHPTTFMDSGLLIGFLFQFLLFVSFSSVRCRAYTVEQIGFLIHTLNKPFID